ncbi:conidial pigment biosynthesis scytalone dehydratase Arp1 [Aspergillus affinis]|uniref:conidial pigment biosynthesis scytalone dehydratase Arp1 n=1 Tax=Aspergillus affinis TaxID=1070780 RepID=UPI0022FF22FB|nr:conidial pigment biosynthesis scytalone dehydratase Arp1 [Aspergillus affinis]KAI9040737.1 conidial pigment biosynthesis scytalone dehydratase Arp1 [Aspergillus affinis]
MSDPDIPLACQNLLHTWATCIDTKSWARLPAIFAPVIDMDYSALGQLKATAVQPSVYIGQVSSSDQLGNPEIQSHHLVGACKWTRESEFRTSVDFQIMTAIRRAPRDGAAAVLATGHGINTMVFAQVNGEWKIAALKVGVLWIDGDFATVFTPSL